MSAAQTFFFFNDTATTEIYTLSLHDALPISALEVRDRPAVGAPRQLTTFEGPDNDPGTERDRKSTRLNSSHSQISYAVFCLKKKKNKWMCNTRKLVITNRTRLVCIHKKSRTH